MSFNVGNNGKPKGFGFSGFTLTKTEKKSNLILPDPKSDISKHGYSTWNAISKNAIAAISGISQKRTKTEEEYFDDDDDMVGSTGLAYIPAPGSPAEAELSQNLNNNNDEDEDPLDAFMSGIEKQVHAEDEITQKTKEAKDVNKGIRDDIEEMDNEESYYKYMEENPDAGKVEEESDVEIEYDEDGNPIVIRSKHIDPLPPIDHSTIEYEAFHKNFYEEHDEIKCLKEDQISDLKQKLGIKVSGASPPKPVSSFAHMGLDDEIMKIIRKSEFTQPTPIQAQGIPVALSGRDIIGIAKTGSGKTLAYIIPLIIHIMDQQPLKEGEGPIGLILAPTRELSLQIYSEARKFAKTYNLEVVCCYGGGSKWEQSKALEAGAEIVVATPGRMIDMIKIKATNVQRVTYLVLDEADRMFDMGFGPQVRSICDHVRPDRQTLMFSATFKKKIEKLARDVLSDPIKVVQGEIGEANEDVLQRAIVLPIGGAKWNWLITYLVQFTSEGSVLIFVTKKANAEELASNLKLRDFQVGLLHGDMDQADRNTVITSFKKKEVPILVATDVAARGLDIPHIKTVINYDVARDIDTHTHRIGRTGRAGEKGTAYTLVTENDKEFAGHIVRNLEGADQEVPEDLLSLALKSSWFRKSRFKTGKGKKPNVGGFGLGYRENTNTKESEKRFPSVNHNAVDTVSPKVVNTPSRGGPGGERLQAMKAAFQAQYKTQFCAASSDTSWSMKHSSNSTPVINEKPRKKTRWN